MADGEELVTYQETGKMLRRSPSTIRRMVKKGQLRTVAVPSRPLVLLSSIHGFLASAKGETLPAPKKRPVKAKRRKR